jgi:hypothetical protein
MGAWGLWSDWIAGKDVNERPGSGLGWVRIAGKALEKPGPRHECAAGLEPRLAD